MITERELSQLLAANPDIIALDNGRDVTRENFRAVAAMGVSAEPDEATLLEANAGALGVEVEAPQLAAQSIVLALPPSANVYWRYGPNGVYVSEKADDYKAGVKWKALHQGMRPMRGDVAVYVNVYRQRKAGDLDNYAKVLCDALSGIAYQDDAQIVELHMWRHDDRDNPRAEVEIRNMDAVKGA